MVHVGRWAKMGLRILALPVSVLLLLFALLDLFIDVAPYYSHAVEHNLELVESEDPAVRIRATETLLDLAERLRERGDSAMALEIYRGLWDRSADADRRHVRCGAIRGLAHVLGPAAVDDLASAIAGDDGQVRACAIAAAAEVPGEDVTRVWVRRLDGADAALEPVIVLILGRRGGPAAAEAILGALGSDRPAVRRAAIAAAVGLGSPKAVGPLVALLASEDEAERSAAEEALARLGGPGTNAALAEHLASSGPAVRERLVEALLARAATGQVPAIAPCLDDASADVQRAACRALAVLGGEGQAAALLGLLVRTGDAGVREGAEAALAAIAHRSDASGFTRQVLGAMPGAGADARAALVRLLAEAPTPAGLEAVRSALEDTDARVRESAIRALGTWPAESATDGLLGVARSGETEKERILAVRALVQQAGRPGRAAADAVALYRQALNAAERPQEKRLALAGLAGVPAPAALALAMDVMTAGSLREEAAAAVIAVAEGIAADHPAEVRQAMEAVLGVVKSDRLRERAERLRQRLGRPRS